MAVNRTKLYCPKTQLKHQVQLFKDWARLRNLVRPPCKPPEHIWIETLPSLQRFFVKAVELTESPLDKDDEQIHSHIAVAGFDHPDEGVSIRSDDFSQFVFFRFAFKHSSLITNQEVDFQGPPTFIGGCVFIEMLTSLVSEKKSGEVHFSNL